MMIQAPLLLLLLLLLKRFCSSMRATPNDNATANDNANQERDD